MPGLASLWAIPAVRYATAGLGVVVLVGAIYGAGYLRGAENKAAEIRTAVEAERIRQEQVNRDALRDAERRVAELEAEAAQREDLVRDIRRATSGRDQRSISPDSLRQLNRID